MTRNWLTDAHRDGWMPDNVDMDPSESVIETVMDPLHDCWCSNLPDVSERRCGIVDVRFGMTCAPVLIGSEPFAFVRPLIDVEDE